MKFNVSTKEGVKMTLRFIEKHKNDPNQIEEVEIAKQALEKILPNWERKTLNAVLRINGIDPTEFHRKNGEG